MREVAIIAKKAVATTASATEKPKVLSVSDKTLGVNLDFSMEIIGR